MAQLTETAMYVDIMKFDEQPDGTALVYGKATDDTLDSDQQVCDPEWLKTAMPEWFKYGNIREQHSSIAAGVATEYENKGSEHFITAHVVDPNSVKKVKAGVLKGFSIGIKAPRVVKDNKAIGGRIVDGQIVEVSLVDRPANPSCTLIVAKAIGGVVTQVEEYVEKGYNPDQERDDNGRFGSGGGSSDNSRSGQGNTNDPPISAEDKATIINDSLDNVLNQTEDTMQQSIYAHAESQDEEEQKWLESGGTYMGYASDAIERAQGDMTEDKPAEAVANLEAARSNLQAANASFREVDHPDLGAGARAAEVDLSNIQREIGDFPVQDGNIQRTATSDLKKEQERDENGRFAGSGGGGGGSNDSTSESEADPAQVADEIGNIQSNIDQIQTDIADNETEDSDEVMGHLSNAASHMDRADGTSSSDDALEHLGNAYDSLEQAHEEARTNDMGDTADRIRDARDSASALIDYISYGEYDKATAANRTKESHVKSKKTRYGIAKASTEMCENCDKPKVACNCADDKETKAEENMETCENCKMYKNECKCAEGGFVATEKTTVSDELRAIIVEIVKSLLPTTLEGGEDAVTKAVESERIEALESELAQVKALAAPSGPSRMGVVSNKTAENVEMAKAHAYRIKAKNTLDADLAKGYLALAKEIESNHLTK